MKIGSLPETDLAPVIQSRRYPEMFCKKWLSLFLIFVLCFSFLQVPALAVTSDGTGNTSDNMLQPGSIQLSGDQASESYSEPSSDHVQESPVETTPLPTADPTPGPEDASNPEPTSAPDSESVSAPTPAPTVDSAAATLPSAEILMEADGVTVYSVVKVQFLGTQPENLSGLQVYNENWQLIDPYIDPVSLKPFYDTYYLSPGIYAYRFEDASGHFKSIDYTLFGVEWDKPEQNFDIVLTATDPIADQIVDMEVHSVTMVNPIYSAVVDAADIPGASTTPEACADLLQQLGDTIADYVEANTGNQAGYSVTFQAAPNSIFSSADTFYKDTSSAGSALKSAMISRTAEIKIFYQSSEKLDWNTVCSNIYASAVTHTGVPTEGDYLLYEFGGYNATGAGPVILDGSGQYSYLFNFAPLYYTTATQEAEMTNAVNAVLSQLNLSGKTEYQKIKAIYDYLCANVTYDDAHANDGSYTLKYTGYAALVQKKAVCQGYSVAFYRLCLEAGLRARVIDSKAMMHAWNIAQVGNKYYHLDATWDAGRSSYLYFLRGNTWWLQNHKQSGYSSKGDKFSNASFSSSYPVPDNDYSGSSSASEEEKHTALTFHEAVEATCTEAGTLAHWICDECGKIFLTEEHVNPVSAEELVVSALGHDFANGVCTRCGDALSFSVHYECNGGTNATSNPSSYTAGIETLLADPARAGYTFGGWYTSSSLSGAAVSKITSETTGDLTLYAKWKANTYTIVFDPNGASGNQRTQAMTYDRTAALTANGFRLDGSAFIGWATSPSASSAEFTDRQSVSNLTADADGTVTLYAIWATNAYLLSFDSNGGNGEMAGSMCNYGATYTLPTCTFTREGYSFTGWATSARGRALYEDGAAISNLSATNGATVTLYAVWTAHQYSIVFDGNGATSGNMRAMENRVVGNTVTLTSNSFRRAGYIFSGWNTMPDGSGTAYSNRARQANFASENGAVLTLYAQWSPVQYKITYRNVLDTDGNTNPSVYTAEDATLSLSGLSRSGYVFLGWYTDSRFANAVTAIEHGTSGNLTLYAKWSPYTYSVRFEPNGGYGTMDSLEGCIVGRSYSLKNNTFKRTGYTFAGWNTAPDGSGTGYVNRSRVTSLASENGAVITLYAQWTEVTYRITYRNVKASDVNPNPVSYSVRQSIVLQGLTREGYVFEGWYKESSFRTPVITINENLDSSGAITVYAKWSQCKYDILFDGNAQGRGNVTGTMRPLTNRLFGRTYALTSCSYRLSGYVFLGWSTDPNASEPTFLNRTRISDTTLGHTITNGETVTLYAVWHRP